MGQRARVLGRELSLGALHCRSTVLLYMEGDSEVDTGGRKDSYLPQTRYDTKAQDRDHIDPKSGHVASQAYDPVTTGGPRLVYCIRKPDRREEKLPCAPNHKRRAQHSLLH